MLLSIRRLLKSVDRVSTSKRAVGARIEALETRLFLSAGDADPTFGRGGLVTAPAVGSEFTDTKVLPDGRILAAGYVYPISNTVPSSARGPDGLYLARFLSDGSPDPSFGNGGSETITAGGFIGASRIALLPDAKFYIAGNVLGRFNADGTLDTTFASGGIVNYNDGSNDIHAGIVVQRDGKIVVTHGHLFPEDGNGQILLWNGFPNPPPTIRPFGEVTRYLSDGSIDTSFGAGGRVSSFDAGDKRWTMDVPTDLTLQGGRIIVSLALAWYAPDLYDVDHGFGVERLNADGTIDHALGDQGIGIAEYDDSNGSNGDVPERVKIAPNGAIYEAGYAGFVQEFHVDRFNSDGTGGTDQFLAGDSSYSAGSDLVFQSDGRIVLFGHSETSIADAPDSAYAIRVNADLSIDPTYGQNPRHPGQGSMPVQFPTFNWDSNGADIDSSGRVVACGGEGDNAVLLRFLADAPTGTISGKVAMDQDHTGNLDVSKGDPNGGRLVYADLNGNGIHDPGEPAAVTRYDGTYQMDVPAGSYTIRLDPLTYYAQEYPANNSAYQVSVSVGQTISGNDFLSVPLPFIISGTVYVDVNGDNTFDAGDTPIGGALIFQDRFGTNTLSPSDPSATTAPNGTYTVTTYDAPVNLEAELPAGYKLAFPANGQWPVDAQGKLDVTGIDFRAVPTGSAPPPVGNPNPPSSNPPPPETLAGDRAALHMARLDARDTLAAKKRQLRIDRAALAQSKRVLRRVQAAARHSGVPMNPTLQMQVDQLDATVTADRGTLASARESGVAAIRAARQKLMAFLAASRGHGDAK